MHDERRLRSAAGGNAHRGAQIPLRRDCCCDISGADTPGVCAGIPPEIFGAEFAVADNNLFWLEPAQSVDWFAARHGDRTAARQLERTDGAARAVRHRENDHRLSSVIDWRAARYRTPGGAPCADDDVLRCAPGLHYANAAPAASGARAVVHAAAGDSRGSERRRGGAAVRRARPPAQVLESYFQSLLTICR